MRRIRHASLYAAWVTHTAMLSVHGVTREGEFASGADKDVEIQGYGPKGRAAAGRADGNPIIHPVSGGAEKGGLRCVLDFLGVAEKRALGVARSFAVFHFPGTLRWMQMYYGLLAQCSIGR